MNRDDQVNLLPMTLRDYFAAQSLNGLLSTDTAMSLMQDRREFTSMTPQQVAAWSAYAFADAMLAEREKHNS